MDYKRVKTFCKVVAAASHEGILGKQQAKTLVGQAKHGDLKAAKKGLLTIMKEVQ